MGRLSDLAKDEESKEQTQIPKFQNSKIPKSASSPIDKNELLPIGSLVENIVSSILHDEQRSASYRVSNSEKEALEDLVFSLKRQGFKRLTANIAIRVALVSLTQDYEQNAEGSLIHKVMQVRYPNFRD